MKDAMDKTLNEQRTLTSPEFAIVNKNVFSSKEAVLAAVEIELQKATIQGIGYVDNNTRETKSQLDEPETDDATVAEENSEAKDLSTNPRQTRKKNAVENMDQSLKLLKSLNDKFSRDESTRKEVQRSSRRES